MVRLLLLLTCWVGGWCARGADAGAAFDAAATLYEQGRHVEAAEAYGRLLTNGIVTPAVRYNQGNAWLRAGRIGLAIVSFREAQRLAPRDQEIAANLAFARSKVPAGTPPPAGAGGAMAMLSLLTMDEWALVALIALWLWVGVLLLRLFRPGLREATASLSWCLGGSTALLAVAAILAWSGHRRGSAVVTASEATLRFGPLTEAQVAYPLPEGAEVRIEDRKNHWFQVRDGLGRRAWVQRGDVGLLP